MTARVVTYLEISVRSLCLCEPGAELLVFLARLGSRMPRYAASPQGCQASRLRLVQVVRDAQAVSTAFRFSAVIKAAEAASVKSQPQANQS